ncbi:IS5/IS1182 family transposase (plasmid) [Azospirillum baldaniorum]|nr:IS5 family transposase [Azospirillum baldaniorum]AWJ90481.1 IS5/IS1182 family transposase [Azospirillum baldaniorum]AWJ93148.1 IS5/IS1182 family transposase [Azospirillum baldaniorum]AWJ94605.1 IS5/IS1182 family transposase [Azospirillum baldaniorum]AWJ94612.1 IS5/IS1182 family transposase [Azospirillum baldaniorum]
MAAPLVCDALWAIIEPLIPPEPPKPKGGRPRLDDRAALTGILFVLRTGIPWELLPVEMGCGSGMTCWRRLHEWHQAGVWERLHRVLLDRLGYANAINWDRAAVDSASVPGKKGGEETGPNPTDRGKPGSKRHILVDANGIPLALRISPANRHDSKLLEALVDAVPAIRQCAGRPRRRPAKLHADKGYDFAHCRQALRRRAIIPRIARRGIESSERLGRHRWVVERTLAWFARFRRLALRYERRADIFTAFHNIAASLICWRFVQRWFC